MSGGGGDTKTTQNTAPWAGQQPYLAQIFQRAAEEYNTGPLEYFPGETVAPFAPETVEAQGALADYARGGATNLAQGAAGANQFALGPVLDVGNNPYVRGAAEASINPVIDALVEQALPAVRTGALEARGYGGSRQQLAEANAIRDSVRAMMDRTAGLYERAYGEGLDTFSHGLSVAPQTIRAGAIPSEMLDTVGQQKRDYDQAVIQSEINRHNFEEQKEWARLGQYLSLIMGNYGGTTEATGKAPGGNTLSQALGGAATGAGLAGTFGAGPVGMGIGAGVGALAGAF